MVWGRVSTQSALRAAAARRLVNTQAPAPPRPSTLGHRLSWHLQEGGRGGGPVPPGDTAERDLGPRGPGTWANGSAFTQEGSWQRG